MKFPFRKSKRELARISYYVYERANVFIKSDVQIYEDQLLKIYDMISKLKSFEPAWEIAKRIVLEVGDPIFKATFNYNKKTGKINIVLSNYPVID